MNILIITSSYPPEIRSSSHLMQELSEELARRGHEVMVATSYPRTNLSKAFIGGSFETCIQENGVKVLRIKTPIHPHKRCHLAVRGLFYLALPYVFFWAIRQYVKGGLDAVIVYSPPLPLALTGGLVKKAFEARFILNIQDVFPQNAIDLGILRNPLLIRLFEAIEKKSYVDADAITAHSVSNQRFLLEKKQVDAEKLTTLHNWVDLDGVPPVSSPRVRFRDRFGLGARCVFFFGGVMGPSQALDVVLDGARKVSHVNDIVFLLVGDGLEKLRLEKRAKDLALKNVKFGPFVDKDDYRYLLQEIDVGLVCLSEKNTTPVVPGKILGYMSASVPVLGFLNMESDGHKIIRDARCGRSCLSDDSSQVSRLILKMYEDRTSFKRLGRNGRNYAEKHFSKQTCVDKVEELIR